MIKSKEILKSNGIFVPTLFTPNIVEQHITGSVVGIPFKKRKSRVSWKLIYIR